MARPPPPRPKADLDEVEAAISALEGRHPQHERSRRETAQAVERRSREIAAELAAGARRRRLRGAAIAAAVVAIAAAGFGVHRLYARSRGVAAALEQAEAPLLSRGLAEVASNQLTARPVLEATAEGGGCFVALATSGRVAARAGDAELTGGASVGWCACATGPVAVRAEGAGPGDVGLALLRVDGASVGGPLGGAAKTLGAATWAGDSLGRECRESMLDAWLARGGPGPSTPATVDDFTKLTGGDELARAGLRPVAAIGAGTSFATVEQGADDCLVAVADSGTLALRAAGGARPIEGATGAMAWCADAKASMTVWRAGASTGSAIVAAVPRAHIGGLSGLREALADAGFVVDPKATWLPEGAVEREAVALLAASTLLDAKPITLPPDAPSADPRPAVFSFVSTGPIASLPAGALLGCDPPLAQGPALYESVCATAGPAAIWREPSARSLAARADFPIFLASLVGSRAPEAIARVPSILGLARRLARAGFEPTVLEGVKELDLGVRVTGRAGEDAVVALGIGPSAPWVHPYSDGPRWTLGGAPRVVPLAPGAVVTMTASPAPTAPIEKRRTIVFRRSIKL